jgi:hypothetical protein
MYGEDNQENFQPMTVDAARQQYEETMHGAGLQKLHVTTENGRSSILGIAVPKTLAPVIETIVATFLPRITRFSGAFAYDKSLRLAGKYFDANKSHNIARSLEFAVRWGLIAAKPVTDFISAESEYSKERKALFAEFAPVMAATKASPKNNEVMRIAAEQLYDDMMTDVKKIAADIPTLVPQVLFALQDQATLRDTRNAKKAAQKFGTDKIPAQSSGIGADFKRFSDGLRNELGEAYTEEAALELFRQQNESVVQADTLHHRDQAKRFDTMAEPWMLAGSAVSQAFKANINERDQQRQGQVNAWEMIKHLKQEMDQQCTELNETGVCERRDPEEIRITGIGKKANREISLKQYVIEIFQQHERDRSHTIGDTNLLGNSLMGKLVPATDIIAEHIADGRLDAYALVNLVGGNSIIQHKNNGARIFASKAETQRIVDDLIPVMSTRETLKIEEFFANFANPKLIQDTLRKNINGMKGIEKAFFVSLFPDEVLTKVGIKKEEIIAFHKEAHDHMYDIVATSVLYMAQKTPEQLKDLGLAEKDIQAVTELAQKIESGNDPDAIKLAVGGRNKTVLLGALRTLGLNEQVSGAMGEGQAFWANRIKEAGNIRRHEGGRDDNSQNHRHLKDESTVARVASKRDGVSEGHLGV